MENSNLFESSSTTPYRATGGASAGAVLQIIRNLDNDAGADGDTLAYSPARLATAARSICAAARDDGLPIEQALIRVKDAWRSTPGRPKPRPGAHDPVLDQLVSACIREFYTER